MNKVVHFYYKMRRGTGYDVLRLINRAIEVGGVYFHFEIGEALGISFHGFVNGNLNYL